jgi:hypothetical protein
MDAYLFTYMNVKEEGVIDLFNDAINRAIKGGKNVITVLWHDSSIKMGGHKKVPEFLASRQDLAIVRGVDLLRRV